MVDGDGYWINMTKAGLKTHLMNKAKNFPSP